MKTTNYYNTFIQAAEDCPVQVATVPAGKRGAGTVATLQFELLANSPYAYTSDEVLFRVHATRNNIAAAALVAEKEKFFSKGQACFRASPLTKRYGWGLHCNAEGKVALVAIESVDYQRLAQQPDLKQVRAMRSKRA